MDKRGKGVEQEIGFGALFIIPYKDSFIFGERTVRRPQYVLNCKMGIERVLPKEYHPTLDIFSLFFLRKVASVLNEGLSSPFSATLQVYT